MAWGRLRRPHPLSPSPPAVERGNATPSLCRSDAAKRGWRTCFLSDLTPTLGVQSSSDQRAALPARPCYPSVWSGACGAVPIHVIARARQRPKQSPASAGVVPQRPLLRPAPSGRVAGAEGAQEMATPSPSRSYQRSARDRFCPSNRSSERSRRILLTAAALTWLPNT